MMPYNEFIRNRDIICSREDSRMMDIKWKRMFPDRILQRGKAYYDLGRVKELQMEDGKYSAFVYGSRIYSVDIFRRQDGSLRFFCTCPHANDGNHCKHMAAVMYAVETEGDLNIAGEKGERGVSDQVYPFGKGGSGEYYDFADITEDLVFRKETVVKAKSMIETGQMSLSSFEEMYDSIWNGEKVKVCVCEGKYVSDNNEAYDIEIIFAKGKVMQALCRVEGCENSLICYYGYGYGREKEMCAHETALFLLADEYIKRNNIGDVTDYGGQRLLSRCRDMRAGKNAADLDTGRDIYIEPRLEIGEFGELSTSFKIGTGKLYMIRNLPEMVEKAERNETLKLGKKENISFASDRLTEEARKYFDFICRELKSESLRENNFRSASRYDVDFEGEKIKGSMPLYGKRLDDFFELVRDKRLQYVSKKGRYKSKGEMGFAERSPLLELELAPMMGKNSFEGVHLGGMLPQMIEGIDNQYFFDGYDLNRTGNEYMDIVELLKGGRYSNEVDLTVGKNNLSEFYYRVLPMLREYASVTEIDKELIEQNLSPEGEFLFKLDAPDDDVTCEAIVNYGEESFKLHDPGMDPGKRLDTFRDIVREHEVVEAIEGWLPYRDGDEQLYHCDCDEDLIYDFINGGVDALLKLGEVEATDRFKRLNVKRSPKVTVGVQLESDLVHLDVTSDDLSQEELLDIINSYRKKKKFHRLRNGDFVNTDDESLEELSAMLEAMKISPEDFVQGKMEIPVYRALYLEKMAERSGSLYMKRDSRFRKLIKEFKTVEESDYEIPAALQGIMRGYQEFGYKWLRTIESYGFGGILADDMGLGKTLQMISLLLDAKDAGRLSTALVVTPASLVYNWKEEFARFAPEMRVCIIAGTKAEREKLLADAEDWDVLITSYDILKRDILLYGDKRFSHEVIDEAQYIKNHTTAASKAVKIISAGVKFAMTGTPIENRLSELWSIFDYMMPGFLYGYETFRRELETPVVKNSDEAARLRLKRMVEPFILRRLKEDVLKDLPDKIEEIQYVAFDKNQRHVYDGQVIRIRESLEAQSDESFRSGKLQILAELTRIRQICCDPSLCLENYRGESAKRQACVELVKNAIDGGHKILLFSQFTSMFELLEKDFAAEGIEYYEITGATGKEKRVELVKRFNEDDTPVFLISLKAGGTGLNLTGADIVIHYDPWWNVAAQNQATDRAHRIGQTKRVSVYKLIVKDTIEEKIVKMQESKKALADDILRGEGVNIFDLSREELMGLL